MALYTEKSYDELSNLFARQERIRQNQLRQQQEQALQEYNNRKNSLDQKYENKGLGGFLGDIVGGIGKGIGDVGKGVVGLFGTTGAQIADALGGTLGSIKGYKEGTSKWVEGKNTDAFKKWLNGTDDLKDAYAKTAGTALNAATTLGSIAVPAAGAGTAVGKVASGALANTAAGALGGVADEFQQQGKDATLEGATNRAISGAAAGLATGGLNKKIGNASSKLGSTLLNNKLATSTLGRGALSGAVGGSVGAGTSAALAGQDVTSAALQGGLTGAAAGATQAGIMAGANKLGQKLTNKGTVTNVEDTLNNTDDFRAYGDSQLAKRTKGNQAAEALSRFGNTLEGAQTNVTRAAARDLGIDNTGKVIENVRKKTGLTNLETQATLAKELTGGADSLMDTIQRNALTATEDGSNNYRVDTTKLTGDVEKIVRTYANRTNMKGEAGVERLVNDIRNDIFSRDTDLLTKANNFKASAAELRGKGIVNPSEGDSAKAKIYSEVGRKLDDLSYSAIPKENVEAMFDATINEMRSRATQAKNNGNNTIAKAYNNLANSLNEQPRTIQAYRSFKKDFVDVSNINQLTSRAENGAGVQLGSSAAGALKRFGNTLLNRPINAALAKAGGVVNNVAGAINNVSQNAGANYTPISPEMQTILGNYIGRTTGVQQADNNIQNLRKEQEYQNLEDELSNATAGIDAMYGTGGNMGLDGSYGVSNSYNAQNSALNQLGTQLANIANAMNNALAAGDMSAYTQLADLYKSAYNTYQMQADLSGLGSSSSNGTNTIKMSTTEKNQLAKLQTAGTAIDELETLFKKAGGGQGIIGGNIANFLGGLGLNSDVNTYNQLSQGLINQIGAAIGKTDALNTEGEVQRALSLVPKLTDDNQTAINKLATLRSLLKTNTGTYNDLYSA